MDDYFTGAVLQLQARAGVVDLTSLCMPSPLNRPLGGAAAASGMRRRPVKPGGCQAGLPLPAATALTATTWFEPLSSCVSGT